MIDGLNWRKSSYSGASGGDCVEVAEWYKSSHSGAHGGNCVEVAEWYKSSYSGNGPSCVEVAEWYKSSYSSNTGACIEVADTPRLVHVHDTQNRRAGHLSFPASSWHAFISSLKSGALAE